MDVTTAAANMPVAVIAFWYSQAHRRAAVLTIFHSEVYMVNRKLFLPQRPNSAQWYFTGGWINKIRMNLILASYLHTLMPSCSRVICVFS
jgi:hypothetical protein